MRIGSRSRQLFAPCNSLISLFELSTHRVFERRRKLFEGHELVVAEFLICVLLEIATRARKTAITSFLNIIHKQLLHIVTSDAEMELFIRLPAVLTECVSEVVVERGGKLARFVFVWIIAEALRRVEKGPSIALILLLSKQVICVIRNFLVEGLVHREALALRKSKACFGRRIIDGSVIFVGHVLELKLFIQFYFIFYFIT